MVNYDSVLNDARQLSDDERLCLIDALWDLVGGGDEIPLDEAWKAGLERRMAAINAGTATLVPWETVREESRRRVGLGDSD